MTENDANNLKDEIWQKKIQKTMRNLYSSVEGVSLSLSFTPLFFVCERKTIRKQRNEYVDLR